MTVKPVCIISRAVTMIRLQADFYCDTQSNIFGTNMFAYCNNNPVNQRDPEGTDAYWVQFGNAVRLFDTSITN